MKVPCLDCGKAHEQTEDCANGENKFIDPQNCSTCDFWGKHWGSKENICYAYGLNNHKCRDEGYNNWRRQSQT